MAILFHPLHMPTALKLIVRPCHKSAASFEQIIICSNWLTTAWTAMMTMSRAQKLCSEHYADVGDLEWEALHDEASDYSNWLLSAYDGSNTIRLLTVSITRTQVLPTRAPAGA